MGRTSDDILCTVGNAKTSIEIKRQDLQVASHHRQVLSFLLYRFIRLVIAPSVVSAEERIIGCYE